MSLSRLKVGVEIHARVRAEAKLFSGAGAWARDPITGRTPGPNSLVGFLDCALPGAMPRLNQHCVDQAIATGLSLSGAVQPWSMFERKHYFYCDSPLGYQITQQSHPVVTGGHVHLSNDGKSGINVRISRIQLEQDTAKSFHFAHGTLVDLNRAGAALMEIVSEPDMNTAKQCAEYVKTVQHLLRHIGTCDGNMEDGSLRADINVSVELSNGRKSHRVEIKNLNSLRSIERAVMYEEKRLSQELISSSAGYSGSETTNNKSETRTFDVKTGETVVLREKETKVDYRFMPEPDLPPLLLTEERIERIRRNMHELPSQTRARLGADGYGLRSAEINILMDNASLLRFFESTCTAAKGRAPPVLIASLLCNTVLGALRKEREGGDDDDIEAVVEAPQLAELAARVHSNAVSSQQAKELVVDFLVKKKPIVEWPDSAPREGLGVKSAGASLSDNDLMSLCEELVRSHPNETATYRAGKHTLLNFFFGKAFAQLKKTGRTPAVDRLRRTMEAALNKK